MKIREYTPGEGGPKDIWVAMTREELHDLFEALADFFEDPDLEWHHHLPRDPDNGVEITLGTPAQPAK